MLYKVSLEQQDPSVKRVRKIIADPASPTVPHLKAEIVS